MRALNYAAWMSALWLTQSPAQQLVEARDGVAVEAILSRQEPTRIRIEGTTITDVFGSVYASNCAPPSVEPALPGQAPAEALAVNPGGEVLLECDRSKGEIYVKPVPGLIKPANLFIASERATYTLVLRPADTPADTIVIRDTTPRTPNSTAPATASLRAIKRLLTGMASGRVPAEYTPETLQRELTLWQGSRLMLTRRYEGRELTGEHYELTNAGEHEIVVAEQEFDQRDGDILGIAIEQHTLAPGARGAVYVIRRTRELP